MFVAALGVGGALIHAPMVQACSAGACFGPMVSPSGGEIPADQLRLRFRPGVDQRLGPASGQALEPGRLFDVTDGTRTPLMPAITVDGIVNVLSFTEAPAPGTTLVLEAAAPSSCADIGTKPLNAEFTITAPAPMPDALGQLSAAIELGMLTVPTRAGSCSVKIEAAYADLKLALADAAKPFVNVIEYQFLLDGSPKAPFSDSLSGGRGRPRGEERVYAPCGSEEHLDGASTLGMHSAKFRGTLPNGVMVESDEVAFELSCGPATSVSHDAGTLDPPDAGPVDRVDAAVASGAAGEPPPIAAAGVDQAGCNVAPRLGSGGQRAWLSIATALLFGFALRTTRRTTRTVRRTVR